MTDANFKSRIYLGNGVKTDALTVTPILHLSNGVQYTLAPVKLEPAGTAVVDINQALADQGVAPYATLSGYVEVQYQWPWAAICATVRDIDTVHSLIFNYGLQPPPAVPPAQEVAAAAPQAHTFEGIWWKQESNVTGFVALSNVTAQPINAAVQVTDNQNLVLGDHSVTVSPHGTKMVSVSELQFAASPSGGILVTHDGPEHGLIINGGLKDEATGYSANLPLAPLPEAAAKASETSYAELGLMSGAADPMMSFPAGTVFTPYSVVRNLSDQAVSVAPTLWWMEGGAARSAQLPPFTVLPHRTQNMDVPSLISSAGLKNFNGSVNLVLDTQGLPGALLIASGSVDQKNTYVFEVIPRAILESVSKSLAYWSTGNRDDTMVTLWNPADEAQELVFTVFFPGGQYGYPIHLGPRATQTFNVSEIIHNQIPDAEGNVIPASVHEGSAEISGSQGENEHILVAMDVGIYNVQKATCSNPCTTCNGFVSTSVFANPFAVAVAGDNQLTFSVQYNSGNLYNRTSTSTSSSSNTGIATVSTGLVHGVNPGSVTINFLDAQGDPVYGTICNRDCPIAIGYPGGSAPGNVKPTVSITGALNFAFVGSDPTVPKVLQQAVGNPSGGTYSWTASPSNRISFDNPSADVVKMSGTNPSTSVGDTTVTVNYTVNSQSANPPATLAVTSRVFKFLVLKSTISVPPGSGHYGYDYRLTYNVYTNPGGQLVQPGFSGITVLETVSVVSTNMSGATTHTGGGPTDPNSEFGDRLALISNAPIPPAADEVDSQDFAVGGFFTRNNTLHYTATTVTVTNNGPTS